MIRTLIQREVLDKIFSAQFLIIMLLCVVLIPLGLFISLKDFEKQQIDYMDNVQNYYTKYQGKADVNLNAEGYRSPSVLNIFSSGLNEHLPYRVVTNVDKGYTIETKNRQTSLISVLFGKIDFTLIVTSFLSILSIIFTFSCVSGEKESGTIRLIFSNSIQKWKFVVAKILGNYILFCIPFFIAVIIGLIIINYSSYSSIFTPDFLVPFLFIIFVTLLLILLLFNLGFFISTLTHSSLTSIIALLFIWVFCAFIIPKVSPMVAQIIFPIDSSEIFETKRKALIEDMEREYHNQLKSLYEQKLSAHNINFNKLNDLMDASTKDAREEYEIEKEIVDKDFQDRFQSEVSKFDKSYYDYQQRQYSISMGIARISPISSYMTIMAEVCQAGFSEIENFRKQATYFQLFVQENIYSHWYKRYYAASGSATAGFYRKDRELDPKTIPVPEFRYNQLTLDKVMNHIWIDFLLIFFFCVVFFLLGFFNFLKYDVR